MKIQRKYTIAIYGLVIVLILGVTMAVGITRNNTRQFTIWKESVSNLVILDDINRLLENGEIESAKSELRELRLTLDKKIRANSE
jgi:hypothetical protein